MFSRLRSLLFWLHLTLGAAAGVVILLMCVTGVALTYEKQLLEWADRRVGVMSPPDAAVPLSPETLLARVVAAVPGAAPTSLTLRADRGAPATVTLEGGRALLVDPTTGRVLGEPSPRLRRVFRTVTNWHRWLALEGVDRATGRAVTGAANLAFLFIVLSGLYLWVPKTLTWAHVRNVVWFRRGLTPKARDFNWHHVIGLWSAVPLALVVAGAVPISYGWAGALVYRVAGEAPLAPVAPRSAPARPAAVATSALGLDVAVDAAHSGVPDWRATTVRLSSADAPLVVTVDRGYGGQPQHRTTLTIDRTQGRVLRRENFDDLGPGRRWRTWFRFVHTGEYYGLAGQTVAGLVSGGGAVLVFTGLALSLRRCAAWRRRRQATSRISDDVVARSA